MGGAFIFHEFRGDSPYRGKRCPLRGVSGILIKANCSPRSGSNFKKVLRARLKSGPFRRFRVYVGLLGFWRCVPKNSPHRVKLGSE